MRTFTIVLLYPDTVASTFGHDTYITAIRADNVPQAIQLAKIEACSNTPAEVDEMDPQDSQDVEAMHVLAVFEGDLADIQNQN